MKNLISSTELYNQLDNPNLIIFDASQEPTEFLPNARFFDLANEFSDKNSPFPNTLPNAKAFEQSCRNLGINNESELVVYDNKGIFNSPRVWWMFNIMGFKNIKVLDGGLPNWFEHHYPTQSTSNTNYTKGNFKANFNSKQVKNIDFIESNIKNQQALVIDARSEGRFNGTAPEPREGLKSGHIPNSYNLPYTLLLENGKFKSKEALKEIFKPLQIEKRPLVFSCGSGVTACIVLLASENLLENSKSVYDGSWTEWATLTS